MEIFMKKILVVGCSWTRGAYGSDNDPNPYRFTPTHILYDLLTNSGLENFQIYNVSIFCNSVVTQAMVIQKYLNDFRPDFVVWQVTTPNRFGIFNDANKFFNAINPTNLHHDNGKDSVQRPGHYLLPYRTAPRLSYDEFLGAMWINPGMTKICNIAKSESWIVKMYKKLLVYGIGDVGYHSVESAKAQIFYTRSLMERANVPHLVYSWLKLPKNNIDKKFNYLDFTVEDEKLLENYWTDDGAHMSVKGNTHLMEKYVAPAILKSLL